MDKHVIFNRKDSFLFPRKSKFLLLSHWRYVGEIFAREMWEVAQQRVGENWKRSLWFCIL
nr:hypothetical protein Itr_chr13CG07040 [Ipomoea trifida]